MIAWNFRELLGSGSGAQKIRGYCKKPPALRRAVFERELKLPVLLGLATTTRHEA